MTPAGGTAEPASALEQKVLRYLRDHHVMTLATAEPWAAAVFYVNEGFTLYFVSSPRSRHAEHLARDARAAATIEEQYRDWREIQGLQLEGRVAPLAPDLEARVRELYLAKFPLLGEHGSALAPVLQALARIRWYAFVPQRVFCIDNRVGFGHRDCLELGGGA